MTHETELRCEAQTRTGTRCRNRAVVYHLQEAGTEYLTCLQHHNQDFRPAALRESVKMVK